MAIQVNYDQLKHSVEVDKLRIEDIKDKFGIPSIAATKRLVKDAGLRIKPKNSPAVILVGGPESSQTEALPQDSETQQN